MHGDEVTAPSDVLAIDEDVWNGSLTGQLLQDVLRLGHYPRLCGKGRGRGRGRGKRKGGEEKEGREGAREGGRGGEEKGGREEGRV